MPNVSTIIGCEVSGRVEVVGHFGTLKRLTCTDMNSVFIIVCMFDSVCLLW